MENKVLPPQLGTKLKIGFTAEINGTNLTLDDVDFDCEFTTSLGKKLILTKDDTVRIDPKNYVAPVDSAKLGIGEYYLKLHILVPDGDFEDGVRDEYVKIPTGIKVI